MKKPLITVLALCLGTAMLFSCGTKTERSSETDKATVETESASDGPASGQATETGTEARESVTDPETESTRETEARGAFRSSGSFSSDTGTYMDLAVDWTAESSDGTHVTLTLCATLKCYSIEVGARPGMGKIQVGDAEYSFSTPALSHPENKKTSFEFFSRSFTLVAGSDFAVAPDGTIQLPVKVVWPFNGVYSKKNVSNVIASAVLQIGTN